MQTHKCHQILQTPLVLETGFSHRDLSIERVGQQKPVVVESPQEIGHVQTRETAYPRYISHDD